MASRPLSVIQEQLSVFVVHIALASLCQFKMPAFVVHLRHCQRRRCARFAVNPHFPHCCNVCNHGGSINGRRHKRECDSREELVRSIIIHFGQQLDVAEEEDAVEVHEARVDDW